MLDEPVVVEFNVFLGGVPLFCPLVREDPFTQLHEIVSRNTRDTKLSYHENAKSLSLLVLKRYWVVTDGRTDGHRDRITIANMCYSAS